MRDFHRGVGRLVCVRSESGAGRRGRPLSGTGEGVQRTTKLYILCIYDIKKGKFEFAIILKITVLLIL